MSRRPVKRCPVCNARVHEVWATCPGCFTDIADLEVISALAPLIRVAVGAWHAAREG